MVRIVARHYTDSITSPITAFWCLKPYLTFKMFQNPFVASGSSQFVASRAADEVSNVSCNSLIDKHAIRQIAVAVNRFAVCRGVTWTWDSELSLKVANALLKVFHCSFAVLNMVIAVAVTANCYFVANFVLSVCAVKPRDAFPLCASLIVLFNRLVSLEMNHRPQGVGYYELTFERSYSFFTCILCICLTHGKFIYILYYTVMWPWPLVHAVLLFAGTTSLVVSILGAEKDH